MNGKTESSNLYLETIAGNVGQAPQGEVTNALDGEAGDYSYYGEEDEGGKVEEDNYSEYEGRVKQRHVGGTFAWRVLNSDLDLDL